MRFLKNIKIEGKIMCETGLHIGSVVESLKIGGTDAPVVMDKLKRVPIIPGSSLKGKMRSLIEFNHELYKKEGEVHSCDEKDCHLCVVFGRPAEESKKAKTGPTRLIVRDSFPDDETLKEWERSEDIIDGTEVKAENWINRITSHAKPRFFERVPAGSKFDLEIILSVYEGDGEHENLKLIFEALKLLEDSYLGGSGSRGYGKVKFDKMAVKYKGRDEYQKAEDWKDYSLNGSKLEGTVEEILSMDGFRKVRFINESDSLRVEG
ncbi:MAG TPA: type III-A CRISPR-associated RAMP protein Csm3 [Thermoplasmata archaeon]|nr:type III-A CRISPR-associated RAMP protein Csm3 [Thermoplasmata archaeon]